MLCWPSFQLWVREKKGERLKELYEEGFLSLKLKAKTKLVATTVDVLAIDERRQDQLDTCVKWWNDANKKIKRVLKMDVYLYT